MYKNKKVLSNSKKVYKFCDTMYSLPYKKVLLIFLDTFSSQILLKLALKPYLKNFAGFRSNSHKFARIRTNSLSQPISIRMNSHKFAFFEGKIVDNRKFEKTYFYWKKGRKSANLGSGRLGKKKCEFARIRTNSREFARIRAPIFHEFVRIRMNSREFARIRAKSWVSHTAVI